MVHKLKKQKQVFDNRHEEYIEPFNERGKVDSVMGSDLWELHNRAFAGTWSQSDKDRIFESLQSNSYFKDSVPLLGVRFNFRPVLKKYWVKTVYGDISEVFAPNRTSIRNNGSFKSLRIVKIVELKK